jgi:uncharacterized membrane protein YphA (DoxX/SURF4 family)
MNKINSRGHGLEKWSIALGFSLRAILGIVFLSSGIIKAVDYMTFAISLSSYGLPQGLALVGFLMPILEVGVGLSFFLNLNIRKVCLFALVMLIAFTGLIFYGVFFGELDSCGCFGALFKADPTEAVIRNLILLCICFFLWQSSPVAPFYWPPKRTMLLVFTLVVVGILTGVSVTLPISDQSQSKVGEKFVLDTFPDNVKSELGVGEKFIFAFSPDCPRCWGVIHNIKSLEGYKNYDVIWVTYGEAEQQKLNTLVDAYSIENTIYRIPYSSFSKIVGTYPKLFFLKDGVIVKKYNSLDIPSAQYLAKISK